MKIAVIDHLSNPGGGSRVVRSLLAAMQKVRPDLEITFFGNPRGIERENIEEIARAQGIKVRRLSSMTWSGRDIFGIKGSRHIIALLQRKLEGLLSLLPVYFSGRLDKELQQVVQDFDVAFFTWPFHLKCPDLECPMVGIFHDFNFRYWFGAGMAAPWIQKFLEVHTPILLEHMTPVVSTEYMKTEVQKFYPQFGDKVHVAPIAPMSNLSQIDEATIEKIHQKFKLPKKFLLAPTNASQHKNLGPLMAATEILRKRGYDIPLVIVGIGTEIYNGRSCPEGIELGMAPQNIYGLGYVDNVEIDGLIQSAQIVVNSSLYEGGNGPGFDAWSRGIPVAMSNIPPFLEHVAYHDVKAAIFNPRSADDIADKIAYLLDNPDKARENAEHSLKAISRFNWEMTAEKYLSVFDLAIASSKKP